MFTQDESFIVEHHSKSAVHDGWNRTEGDNYLFCRDAVVNATYLLSTGYYDRVRVVIVWGWTFSFWRFTFTYENSAVLWTRALAANEEVTLS